jgi:hypothetical protein
MLTCAEVEAVVCEYVDGELDGSRRVALEHHLAQCPACQVLVDEQRGLLSFLEGVPEVEPPAQLITRLIQDSPLHRQGAEQRKRGRVRRFLAPLLDPILQPRFAMGMAMTILSFSMLGKFAAPVKQLKPSDLDPVKVWVSIEDKAHRTWDRGVKYYENLKTVWEIQTGLADLDQAPAKNEEAPGKTKAEESKQ